MKFLSLAFTSTLLLTHSLSAASYKTYIIAGQSNADGYGQSSLLNSLAPNIASETAGVEIYHVRSENFNGGSSSFQSIVPGAGSGSVNWGADNVPINGGGNAAGATFGPELGIARTLKSAMPTENIRIIKFTKGGSNLDDYSNDPLNQWQSDLAETNLYDRMLTTVDAAIASAGANGDTLDLAGMFWLQGEGDAYRTSSASIAGDYGSHLSNLIDNFRSNYMLAPDDFRVIAAELNESNITGSGTWDAPGNGDGILYDHMGIVNTQITSGVTSGNYDSVSTSDLTHRGDVNGLHGATADGEYTSIDGFHYNSADYLTLGDRLGTQMVPEPSSSAIFALSSLIFLFKRKR